MRMSDPERLMEYIATQLGVRRTPSHDKVVDGIVDVLLMAADLLAELRADPDHSLAIEGEIRHVYEEIDGIVRRLAH